MDKVIVTGANGFLGTSLIEELLNDKVRVYAVYRDIDSSVKMFEDNPYFSAFCCDLHNYLDLPNIILERDFDTIFHFSWIGTSGPLRADYNLQLENVKASCDLVYACKELRCKKIVFAASVMEYEISSLMKTECSPSINSLYSIAKLSADYMVRTIANNEGICYLRAIISNVYGPGEKSPRLINSSLRKMLSGEHCSFSKGTQMYDFIYISDATKAFLCIGEKGISNKSYYIGSKHPRALKDFLLEMRDLVDPKLEIGLGDLPFEGVSLDYNEFDTQALEIDTGFIPQISFSEGICKTIEWLCQGV